MIASQSQMLCDHLQFDCSHRILGCTDTLRTQNNSPSILDKTHKLSIYLHLIYYIDIRSLLRTCKMRKSSGILQISLLFGLGLH
jgi:hypothetical protein